MENRVTIGDLGILYNKKVFHFFGYGTTCNVGVSLLNISKKINYEELKSEYLPLIFKAGYQLNFRPGKNRKKLKDFSFSHSLEYSDILNTDDDYYRNYQSLGAGFEVLYKDLFFLRTGCYYQKSYKDPSEYYSPYTGFTYGTGVDLPVNRLIKKIPLSITYDYARFPFKSRLKKKRGNNLSLHTINIKYNL